MLTTEIAVGKGLRRLARGLYFVNMLPVVLCIRLCTVCFVSYVRFVLFLFCLLFFLLVYCLLSVVRCLLSVACYLLSVICHLPSFASSCARSCLTSSSSCVFCFRLLFHCSGLTWSWLHYDTVEPLPVLRASLRRLPRSWRFQRAA